MLYLTPLLDGIEDDEDIDYWTLFPAHLFGEIPEYIKVILTTLDYPDLVRLGNSHAHQYLQHLEVNRNFTILPEHREYFLRLAKHAHAIIDNEINLADRRV